MKDLIGYGNPKMVFKTSIKYIHESQSKKSLKDEDNEAFLTDGSVLFETDRVNPSI